MAARRKKARKARGKTRKTAKRGSGRRTSRKKSAKKCACPQPLSARPVGLLKSLHKQVSNELAKRGAPMTRRDKRSARRAASDRSQVAEFYD